MNNQYDWWLKNIGKDNKIFEDWLGDINQTSRKYVRGLIKERGIKHVLDVACGYCMDLEGYRAEYMDIRYIPYDVNPKVIERAEERYGVYGHVGNIENLPFDNDSFECVTARHILEHLEYYEKALSEMFRVARRYVFVVLFLPLSDKDNIKMDKNLNEEVYLNEYSRGKLEVFLSGLGRYEIRKLSIQETLIIMDKT